MNINYAVTRNDQRHALKIEGASPDILLKIMTLMTGTSVTAPQPPAIAPLDSQEKPPSAKMKKRTAEEVMDAVKAKAPVKLPEAAPLPAALKHVPATSQSNWETIHREHGGGTPIGHLLKGNFEMVDEDDAKDRQYDIPERSIRLITATDGEQVESYLTKLNCPSCNTTGHRYNLPTNRFCKCFTCGEKLELEQAMPHFLQPDKDGYLFFASRRYFNR